jgi:hypothetical protein
MGEGEDPSAAQAIQCAECGTLFNAGDDREVTDRGAFCRPCYNNLAAQVQQAIAAQSQDVNYSMALVGAVGGAVIGVLAWWGFTVVTHISFGLVAVVIGIAVGKGAVMLSGDKRSTGLQALSVSVSVVAFFYASYLVNRTFVHRAFEEEGVEGVLPLLPSPGVFVEVIGLNFGFMDLIFLAIVVYEAWKIPAPISLAPAS